MVDSVEKWFPLWFDPMPIWSRGSCIPLHLQSRKHVVNKQRRCQAAVCPQSRRSPGPGSDILVIMDQNVHKVHPLRGLSESICVPHKILHNFILFQCRKQDWPLQVGLPSISLFCSLEQQLRKNLIHWQLWMKRPQMSRNGDGSKFSERSTHTHTHGVILRVWNSESGSAHTPKA